MIFFSENDGCAMVFCISKISLLDIKSSFLLLFFLFKKKSPLFQFGIAISDIWIFLIPKGNLESLVEKNNSSFFNVVSSQH